MRQLRHVFLLLLAVLPLSVADHVQAQDGSVATDKAALVALYNATAGANWTPNTNWTSTEPLSAWHGVTTNSDGRVTRLELNDNGLDGTLPAALGDLSALEQLDLQDNALSGALPDELADLTSLTSLLLNESRALTGPLPDGLRELSDLETVNIEKTELCAPDGDAFQTWLDTITFRGLICSPAEQSVIDVAVFYTPATRENVGGIDEIATAIDLMVAETNTAYSNSGVNQRIKLVAVEEVVGYTEQHDLQVDLFRLRSPSDGYMDEIHDIRDAVAADVVLLIPVGSIGWAFQMFVPSTSSESQAFGVVNAKHSSTFAHELGHIMGLQHDRHEVCGNNCSNVTRFPYAFGYENQRALEPSPPDTAFWRTIMAYNSQCAPCSGILRFSNPDQIYPDPGGDPLGKAGLEPAPGADGPSDAVRMLNRTRGYVANFRSAPAITVSFDAEQYTAAEGGTVATVTVRLSAAPTRAIDIAFTATSTTGAAASDYTVPRSVSFAANDTEQTFTITAVDDAVDDDGETVTLTLGHLLPGGVSAGSPATATVTLTDNDPVTGAPSILGLSLTSDPGEGYATGEQIEATVQFDKTVAVTGEPQLELTVGSVTRQASYEGGAREVVTFSYEVAANETDADGVSIAANALSRNSGTIRDSANRAAGLTHSALAADAKHRVDGVAPMLLEAVVDETILTLTYDEPLAQPAPRASSVFAVAAIRLGDRRHAPKVVVGGSVMTVTLWDPVLAGEEVTVSFSNAPVSGAPHLIRDLAGNPAASLRRHAVTNVTKERPYDTDGDGLIEITTLAQLDAVRHDLNGDGVPTTGGASTYRAAFPDAFVEVGSQLRCVLECDGYELMADLDFDTDDDGDVDADDTYWNSGAGWNPIGRSGTDFLTTFEGNGHTVRNLFMNRPSTNYAGLFGYTDWRAAIRNVGLIQVDVAGRTHVGGLVGNNLGTITACYATGHVSGSTNIGGLVGTNYSSVRSSYATARVSGRSSGGLVGRNLGIIIDASYATGEVSGRSPVGGLVGYEAGNTVRASYASGRVSGSSNVGGLVGGLGSSTITASYWDTTTSGQTTGDHGTGQTTAQLQAPTDDTGIYADWDADQWDFGETDEYPVLVVDFDGDGDATWQEFGYQLRAGPTSLTVATDTGLVELSWTAVTPHWTPPPDVTYTVYRATDSTVEAVAEDLTEDEYTDRGVTRDTTYTYQVAAVVNGGEATRSGLSIEVRAPNQPPAFDDGPSTTRTIPENTPGNIGLPVSATDPDADTLIYSLDAASAAVFTVDASGQLQPRAALDHEATPSYTVTVSVRDGKDTHNTADMATDDEIIVTITVTDVNESPVAGDDQFTRPEDTVASLQVLANDRDPEGVSLLPEIATHPRHGTAAVATDGQITYTPPAHFTGEDAFTYTVSDGTSTATATVTLTVTPVNDAGQVTLPPQPLVNASFTATLSEPDALVSGPTWQWARTQTLGNWTDITGARAATYTPVADDEDYYLQVQVSYTDSHGQQGPLTAVSSLVEKKDTNEPPEFEEGTSAPRTIAENTPSGDPIGAPVTATDPDDLASALTYTLSGRDAPFFAIDAGGQLTVGEGTVLDYETKREYRVTVTVTDPANATDSITVMIEILDVNEVPTFPAATATRSIAEDTAAEQAIGPPVTATDDDNDLLTYSLDTASESFFTIDERTGQVQTKAELDHETQPRYFVTISVSDGKDDAGNPDLAPDATIDVTVTVTDAPGRVTVSSTRPLVGRALTATVADPDSPVSVATWHWERSADGVTWSLIVGATTALYTPGATDYGRYLRATVTYTDADGTAKEVTSVQTQRVARQISPPPPPPPPGPGGGGGGPACAEDLHGNSAAQATNVVLDIESSGAICPAADVDYFTVTAPGQGLVFVDTFGGMQPRGTIWQNEVPLASGPTRGGPQDARLGARVQAGPVVVAIQGQGGATGSYDVIVTFVQGYLENPGPASFQSGVGVLSGWVCEAEVVEIELNGVPQEAAYGTERLDTAGVCGDTDNGFGLLFNWNLLRDGEHDVVALVDGVELGRATVTVTTLGQEFLRGVEGTCEVEDFPTLGQHVTLVWQQNSQNFVIAGGSPPVGANTGRPSGLTGFLENPGQNSFQSGVRVLSGWVCDADTVELAIGTAGRQVAAYGTERLDTAGVCGDTDNGFGLLFNWNLLGEGEHEVVAYVDNIELGRATVRVTTVGEGAEEEFLRGAEGECMVEDFPRLGQSMLLEWQQNSQNFVITDFE